jgi:hypothetical protein
LVDLGDLVQAILFAMFSVFTLAVDAVLLPTYNNLLVPELDASSLYPALSPSGPSSGSFLSLAAQFSNYLLVDLVDPLVVVLVLLIGIAYLLRASFRRFSPKLENLFPRLLIAVLLSNFTLPIAGAILGLAGATYPVVAGFDGGAWRDWTNLFGFGGLSFSWDNGVLAFVVSFLLFSVVLLLAIAVAVRDAMLAVLLVLLPICTLLWPIPTLAPLARRAWKLFGELAFWPCVAVIPLELAVGSSSILVLLAFLTLALGSPALISTAGAQLSGIGFPSAGPVLGAGVERGLMQASRSVTGYLSPLSGTRSPSAASAAAGAASGGTALPAAMRAVGGAARAAGGSAFPAALPVLAGEFLGRGTAHLVQHLRSKQAGTGGPSPGFPAVRPKGPPPR